jgi:hypothetical protein
MILNNPQIDELLTCFHNDMEMSTKDWIIKKHPKTIKFIDINVTYSPLNNKIVNTTLEGIISAILEDESADYFFISDTGRLGWCNKNSQVVPADGLQVNKAKIKTFIRNLKLEQIGI